MQEKKVCFIQKQKPLKCFFLLLGFFSVLLASENKTKKVSGTITRPRSKADTSRDGCFLLHESRSLLDSGDHLFLDSKLKNTSKEKKLLKIVMETVKTPPTFPEI